jgi:hypothetical protein
VGTSVLGAGAVSGVVTVTAVTDVPANIEVAIEIFAPFVEATTDVLGAATTDSVDLSSVTAETSTLGAVQADSVDAPTVSAETTIVAVTTSFELYIPVVTAWTSAWGITSGTFADLPNVTAATDAFGVITSFDMLVSCVSATTEDLESLGEWGVPTPERMTGEITGTFDDIRMATAVVLYPWMECKIVIDQIQKA